MGSILSTETDLIPVKFIKLYSTSNIETNDNYVIINDVKYTFYYDIKTYVSRILNDIQNTKDMVKVYYYENTIYGIVKFEGMYEERYMSKKVYFNLNGFYLDNKIT